MPRCHFSNNSVSEEVKLSERTSRVGKSKFDSSVNYRDLGDDDITNRASPLLHIRIFPVKGGAVRPHCGTGEWWVKLPVVFHTVKPFTDV